MAINYLKLNAKAFELSGYSCVTIVQDLLGHSSLNTTAIYLRMSSQEAKMILKDRGLI